MKIPHTSWENRRTKWWIFNQHLTTASRVRDPSLPPKPSLMTYQNAQCNSKKKLHIIYKISQNCERKIIPCLATVWEFFPAGNPVFNAQQHVRCRCWATTSAQGAAVAAVLAGAVVACPCTGTRRLGGWQLTGCLEDHPTYPGVMDKMAKYPCLLPRNESPNGGFSYLLSVNLWVWGVVRRFLSASKKERNPGTLGCKAGPINSINFAQTPRFLLSTNPREGCKTKPPRHLYLSLGPRSYRHTLLWPVENTKDVLGTTRFFSCGWLVPTLTKGWRSSWLPR